MVETRTAIIWWENDLNSEQRRYIFDKELGEGKSWSDIGENNTEGIKKRHAWLRKVYNKYHRRYK